MASESFVAFSNLTGSRIAHDSNIEAACEVIDQMPFADLLSMLTVVSQTRSNRTTAREVIDGNRFHAPSNVSDKDFHWLEGLILDSVNDDTDMVELSPLQPFGINRTLAGTNQKNIVSALRRSEVDADATTALFRIALQRYLKADGSDNTNVRVGSNVRTVRAQIFDTKTNFLPHFKVFGVVSVGKQTGEFGSQELTTLVEHLGTEVDIIDKLGASERSNMANIHISIGNLALLSDLAVRGDVDLVEARRNTINPEYSLIAANDLDMPEYVPLDDPNLQGTLAGLGFRHGLRVSEKIRQKIETNRPDLLPRVSLHLGRVAGIGYYKHICYKLEATNMDGVTIPVADGGSTDWATKVTGNKQLYTVSSGVGTELVCQYLIN
jgi:hypothetical protein